MAAPTPPATAGASISDILTTLKNLVTALNNVSQTMLDISGITNFTNISATTVVKGSAGRLVNLSVLTVGSANGMVYDGSTVNSTTKPLFEIPNVVGVYEANWPVGFGILVVPGDGQVLSVSFS